MSKLENGFVDDAAQECLRDCPPEGCKDRTGEGKCEFYTLICEEMCRRVLDEIEPRQEREIFIDQDEE